MDQFEVKIISEPGRVEILEYTLPSGEVVKPEFGNIDLRPMKSFAFFDFILITNPNNIKQTRHQCTFYGLKKGKEGIDAMHYDVIKELPKKA